MSKTAEEVANSVPMNESTVYSVDPNAVVRALRSAGWLRSTANVEDLCPGCADAIGKARKERDVMESVAKMAQDHASRLDEKLVTAHDTIARLTRERDEARERAERWQEEARTYALNADCWRSQSATQSSPEVLAVVEAAKNWRGGRKVVGGDPGELEHRLALDRAVDALAAVERKAEPKPEPRKFWTTEVWPNGSIQQFGVQRGSEWHGPFAPEVCHALAIALNAADAAGRKS